jgi:hypothetical protein
MTAHQNGNDVAHGEQKIQQSSPIIEKIQVPTVEILFDDNCSQKMIRERE